MMMRYVSVVSWSCWFSWSPLLRGELLGCPAGAGFTVHESRSGLTKSYAKEDKPFSRADPAGSASLSRWISRARTTGRMGMIVVDLQFFGGEDLEIQNIAHPSRGHFVDGR
jgi:hypothetical protein